ncbi:MAG: TIGR03905 family TSCPD domain-containing protein [Acutalibacteraceae bacterium]|nr:TIGR03905 family TSCPD domain-containing protein [Acutalibacteraceae bacterium]
MTYHYTPKGVCSRSIDFEVDNGVVTDISFVGGCNGNLKGISSLVKGMKIDDIIERLDGIKCGFKDTSCPAQLAMALKEYKTQKED